MDGAIKRSIKTNGEHEMQETGIFERFIDAEELYDPEKMNLGEKQTIVRLLQSGELKAFKLGRRWKVRPSDLRLFLDQRYMSQEELQAA